ncbi:TetR/AcrR family transcriptional regulator [Companilactobacillus jidongensis]|uniref:TetR/AcrR family transcriptional regulator n=1 Tax=Companilactobacillus jidongensis TaxID=2486006 RepID=UPI000F7B6210|nr:TetR/AcrR family transcriptional regulator [Companilactobacillus jidongensis]
MVKKSDIQKEKILKAAQNLFAEKGFEATTTREINRAVGISDGSLYYYFPDGKKQILNMIVKKGMIHREQGVVRSAVEVHNLEEFEKQIMDMYDRICEIFSDEEGYRSFMITIRERAILSNEQSEWISQVLTRIKMNLTASVKSIQNQIRISDEDVASLTDIIVAIMQRSIYEELLIKNKKSIGPEVRNRTVSQVRLFIRLITK